MHQTHLKMSLFDSGPRLIHCDCQALWRWLLFRLVLMLAWLPLAISVILSRGLRDVGSPAWIEGEGADVVMVMAETGGMPKAVDRETPGI